MTYSSCSPLRKVWIARWWEKTSIILRCCGCRRWWNSSHIAFLLLVSLSSCLLRSLPLLPVVNKKCERQREAHNDECVNEAVVVLFSRIVRRVSAWHGVVVNIVVQPIVVEVAIILDEVVDPFTKGPVLLCFYYVGRVSTLGCA